MLLLDTHAFIWLVSDQRQLDQSTKKIILNSAGNIFLSSISALEIGLLYKRGRLSLPIKPKKYIEEALSFHEIVEIPLDWEICLLSTQLPQHHRDPFDRIILATALKNKLKILSKDGQFKQYHRIKTVW